MFLEIKKMLAYLYGGTYEDFGIVEQGKHCSRRECV